MDNPDSAVDLLDENPPDIRHSVILMLLQIADNIINYPEQTKFRRLRLTNANVVDKLIPTTGAIECLFEMGFEEADDSFILPSSAPIRTVTKIREKLAHKIAMKDAPQKQPTRPLFAPPSSPNKTHNNFLSKIPQTANQVLIYEDESLQKQARACVPEADLWLRAQNQLRSKQLDKVSAVEAEEQGLPDLLLIELLMWFKHSFFKWVDAPPCNICKEKTSFIGLSADNSHLMEAPRTELYSCKFDHITPFHRYSDPRKLLVTRKGRCGEWANCFTLICRSLGLDARIVHDETDHVWTEVWSVTQNRWLHCDACEAVCDAPLTYQAGWGKKLTYVIAYSKDDVQDVTWRYTQEPVSVVLARRNNCTETSLVDVLLQVRERLQARVSPARKRFLQLRLNAELISFIRIPGQQRELSETETQGRQSGSTEWRLQRKEIREMNPSWVWRPTSEEVEKGCMVVKYSAARNMYERSSHKQNMQGWSCGVFRASNVAIKEERDWNKVYLARTENSKDDGWVEWKFDVGASNEMERVNLHLSSTVYGSGKIQWQIQGNMPNNVINIPGGLQSFTSEDVKGWHSLTLRADLRGGDGNVAWQHTQLSRQDLSDLSSFPIQVLIKFSSS